MDTAAKLTILAGAAKYDASCASSGSSRGRRMEGRGQGTTLPGGCCHSWSDDGRCISLLKILFSNTCIYDCLYCVNRRSNDIPRATFTVEEIVDLTSQFYRRNYIEGLFLSSGVVRSPDYTMERLCEVCRRLRQAERFRGYIHIKILPGASPELVRQAGLLADRISVNIELPSSESLQRLAPDKHREGILAPMKRIGTAIVANRDERRQSRRAPAFAPAGQSTQMIIGATPESDYQILRLSQGLYRRVSLKRVYYSAYVPVNEAAMLPVIQQPPLRREHRLYQADWLLRLYHFEAEELLSPEEPFLDAEVDPKVNWALRHLENFPIEVNRADPQMLLRVPGIGIISAQRIVTARRWRELDFETLGKFGVVLKRAAYFITCGGRMPVGDLLGQQQALRLRLLDERPVAELRQPLLPSWGDQAGPSRLPVAPVLQRLTAGELEPAWKSGIAGGAEIA
jgi:putative DNA modification/repair radical SAM protein